MNFKHFNLFLALVATGITFGSCTDNDSKYYAGAPSKDALIYSLSLSAKATNAIDSIAYPVLKKTFFSVDENYPPTIFNADSLPYNIDLKKKFATAMTFGPSGVRQKIDIVYGTDSIGNWNAIDSIDYSLATGFIVTAADNLTKRTYILKLNVHKIDPDLMLWEKNLPKLDKKISKQKTVAKGDVFYSFHLIDNVLNISTFDKQTKVWTDQQFVKPLPVTVVLGSISVFNNTFFAVDETGTGYSSTDGLNWTPLAGDKVHNILGVLPGKTTNEDQLLVIKPLGSSGYEFARTMNMTSFEPLTVRTSLRTTANVAKNFPARGFTSTVLGVGADRSLLVLGGADFDGNLKNTTWSIVYKNNLLEVLEINKFHDNILKPNTDIASFRYDDKLYAINDTTFVVSTNYGATWDNAPEKQSLDPLMSFGFGQSVLVDDKNNIWIFGGMSNTAIEVSKGRLNKLNPKD